MFSGLNVSKEKIISHEYKSGSLFIFIQKPVDDLLYPGTRVSINGVALSVRAIVNDQLILEAVQKTISKTTYGLSIPSFVTFERALSPQSSFF